MDEIERKTTQDIKDYVKSLDTPDNEVYQQNSLLIMSCFSKAIEFIEQNAKLRQADVGEWVVTSQWLPPIDEGDKWNRGCKISIDVLTYSKDWGMRFGRYFHASERWTINGVTSSDGVRVDYWQEIKPPCY